MADLYAYMFKTGAAERWYENALTTVESIADSGDENFDQKVIQEYRGRLKDHIGKIKVNMVPMMKMMMGMMIEMIITVRIYKTDSSAVTR